MNAAHAEVSTPGPYRRPIRRLFRRYVVGTEMPVWLLLVVVALGLPRTILADLGVVEPEGSLVYYVLALVPFAAWFAVAVVRRTNRPVRDHLVTGAAYGLSLVLVHEALWNVPSSLGHHPPQSAVRLAERFGPVLHEVILHASSFAIAMMIGLGVGVVAGLVGTVARLVRAVRAR